MCQMGTGYIDCIYIFKKVYILSKEWGQLMKPSKRICIIFIRIIYGSDINTVNNLCFRNEPMCNPARTNYPHTKNILILSPEHC